MILSWISHQSEQDRKLFKLQTKTEWRKHCCSQYGKSLYRSSGRCLPIPFLIPPLSMTGLIQTGRSFPILYGRPAGSVNSVNLIASDNHSLSPALAFFLESFKNFTVVSISIVARVSRPTIAETSIPPFKMRLLRYGDRAIRSKKRPII